jgi:hypothetical protein
VWRVLAQALAALALIPAGAHAAGKPTTYTGTSDQGLPVSAVIHDGKIDRIKLRWSADCSPSGWVWGPQGTIWFNRAPGPFSVSGKRFSDKGKFERPFQIGKVVISQKLSGRTGARAISGVQTSTVRLIDAAGIQQDLCSSKVHFHAVPKPPPGPLLGLEGDA